MNNNQSPFSETLSIIAILAGLAALGCYQAATHNAPVVTPILIGLASILYSCFPALNGLQGPQASFLLAAATAGVLCFLALLPLAFWLSSVFGAPAGMEAAPEAGSADKTRQRRFPGVLKDTKSPPER
jgi:hypothetical protein